MREPQGRPLQLPPRASLFPIGAVVKGRDCAGQPFTGLVTSLAGAYSLILDADKFTPTNLIDTVNGRDAPQGDFNTSVLIDADPVPPAGGGVFD